MSKTQLHHISHNHYFLTPKQAKNLCVDGILPREGYEKKADLTKLANCELGESRPYPTASNPDNRKFYPFKPQVTPEARAWITRTPLSWFNGKHVTNRWVWCVHIHN